MTARRLFLSMILAITAMGLRAQIKVTSESDVILTQHWAMPTLLNPAAAGDIDFIRIRGGARLDYFGSHYSPKSFLATADSPFKLLGKRVGAGVVINSKSYDLYRNLNVSAQGSYQIKAGKGKFSIGLQIGYYHTKFKGSEMLLYNDGTGDNPGGDTGGSGEDGDTSGGDTGGGGDTDSGDYPDDDAQNEYPNEDIGAGVFDLALGVRYQHPKFYAALSVLHLTNPKMKMGREGDAATDRYYIQSHLPMTMYFEAGGNIRINNSLISLQPSLVVASDFSDFTGVAEMRATYNEKVTFGLNYRYNRAAGVVAGLSMKNFYIGYAWEYDYQGHPKGSTGNHELVLGYQFKMNMGGKSMFRQRAIRIM